MSIPGSAEPLLLAQSGGYQIERSLRFNSSDSAYLSRTPASAGNRQTWTVSLWAKRAALGSVQYLWEGGSPDGTTTRLALRFNSSDQLNILNLGVLRTTTQVFRDPSAWYHIVVAVDTPQATAANRLKIYVNGSQVTDFASSSDLSQNADTGWNMAAAHSIGRTHIDSGFYFNGYIADFHNIDGQALTPSSFAETNATTGQWVPKAYSGSYGTNGFWLKFSDNSAATATTLGKDYSGNNNNWSPNNLSVGSVNNGTIWRNTLTISAAHPFNTGTGPAFDGNTATSALGAAGAFIEWTTSGYSFPPNSLVEVYANTSGTLRWWRVDTGSGYGSPIYEPAVGWFSLGTYSNIQKIRQDSDAGAGYGPGWSAIRINGTILIDGVNDTSDSLVDTPTSYGTDTGAGEEVRGNYCTFSAIDKATTVNLTNGGLDVAGNGSGGRARASFAVSSGKWYFEFRLNDVSGGGTAGFMSTRARSDLTGSGFTTDLGVDVDTWGVFTNGVVKNNGSNGTSVTTITTGDIGMFALDMDSGKFWYGKNGTWSNSGNPATGANAVYSNLSGYTVAPGIGHGVTTNISYSFNFGQRPFAYTAPSGFKALCDTNLPAPVVAKPNTVMDVKLYTGNGSTQTISGLGFSPDLVWIKKRSGSEWHCINDTVRGAELYLSSNTTNAESGANNVLTAFTSTGYTVGSQGIVNDNGFTFASWCWDAGSSTVTNNSGSISSQVRANASAGFSIVTYTGTGSAATVGHGLGVAPRMVIVKRRNGGGTENWMVYHASITTPSSNPAANRVLLNLTNASNTDSAIWNDTQPTSAVFSVGTSSEVNANTGTYVAYCFAAVAGYSAMGSYVGNGTTNRNFIFTGFIPKTILVKKTNASGTNWRIIVPKTVFLSPNTSDSEYDGPPGPITPLANGFEIFGGADINNSGDTYIYCAWAESPFQYARAR